jgi:hypothetical protein
MEHEKTPGPPNPARPDPDQFAAVRGANFAIIWNHGQAKAFFLTARPAIAAPGSLRRQGMNRFKKILTTGLVAATLGSTVLASTPASAWCNGWGCGGWGGGPSAGAVAAGVVGGMALGALAAGAASSAYPGYYGYPAYSGYPAYPARSCRARSPVYDAWGNFVGYQRVYVAC